MTITALRIPTSLAWALLLVAAALTSCATIEHVRIFRDARTEFSQAASIDNARYGKQLVATNASIATLLPNAVEVQASFERWSHVASLFVALNRRAEDELRADDLFGSSRVLELVARSQLAFYGHELEAMGQPTAANAVEPIEPLTAIVAEAQTLMQDSRIRLFARDAYLARSLAGEVRYKIAFLAAERALLAGKPADEAYLNAMSAAAEQMAQAETEIASATAGTDEAIVRQAALARLAMLKSARYLISETANQAPPQARTAAPILAARLDAFHAACLKTGTPEWRLMRWIVGRDPKEEDLAGLGLGRFTSS
jgi:hypothetical protein